MHYYEEYVTACKLVHQSPKSLHKKENFRALEFQEQKNSVIEHKEYQIDRLLQNFRDIQFSNPETPRVHVARMMRLLKKKKHNKPGVFTSTTENLFFSFCIEVSTCLHII